MSHTSPTFPNEWLGVVVPSVGDSPSNYKNPQAAQAADAAAQQAAQASFMPPAPTWTREVDENGMATAPWVVWYQTLQRRIGSYAHNPADDSALLPDSLVMTIDQAARDAVEALQFETVVPPVVPDADPFGEVRLQAPHNLTPGLQGGSANERYHLTAAQVAALGVGIVAVIPTGASVVVPAGNQYNLLDLFEVNGTFEVDGVLNVA